MKIQDGALVAAVVLSHRYISDRFLPDKAIDLVDEACAMLRTEIDSMTVELDADGASKIFSLIEALEDSDVQNVYANLDVSDEVMEQVG